MEQRVGEDFDRLIVSVTKFGIFVELTELFIEDVPLNSLPTKFIRSTKTAADHRRADPRRLFDRGPRRVIG